MKRNCFLWKISRTRFAFLSSERLLRCMIWIWILKKKKFSFFFVLWWSILRWYNDIFYWLIDQLYSIRFFFAFDASSLDLWKYCWWKFLIKSSAWTSSTYIHWFSIFDQFNHLTKYCNLFRYNLLFNINFTSSCFSSFIMIENDVIILSNRFLNDFNKKTWKTLCIRNVWNKSNLYACFSTRFCISNDSSYLWSSFLNDLNVWMFLKFNKILFLTLKIRKVCFSS
jgi:hypothetical protein